MLIGLTFFPNSGRISAWLCCFVSCKSCRSPGKHPAPFWLLNKLTNGKKPNACLICFAGTVCHTSHLSGLPFSFFKFTFQFKSWISETMTVLMMMCCQCGSVIADLLSRDAICKLIALVFKWPPPRWRLKTWADEDLLRLFFCCCWVFCLFKRGWSLNGFRESVTPPAAQRPLHRRCFTLLTPDVLGGWLTFWNVVQGTCYILSMWPLSLYV